MTFSPSWEGDLLDMYSVGRKKLQYRNRTDGGSLFEESGEGS